MQLLKEGCTIQIQCWNSQQHGHLRHGWQENLISSNGVVNLEATLILKKLSTSHSSRVVRQMQVMLFRQWELCVSSIQIRQKCTKVHLYHCMKNCAQNIVHHYQVRWIRKPASYFLKVTQYNISFLFTCIAYPQHTGITSLKSRTMLLVRL